MSSSSSDKSHVPHHLGIIPDGNRRWARAKGLPTLEGHRQGLAASRKIAMHALDKGVKILTMYGFSRENWQRTAEEVGYLMELFYGFVTKEFDAFAERGVRFRMAGQRDGLSPRLVKAIDKLEEQTAGFTNGTFVLCLNYGGQQELADAAAALIRAGVAAEDVTSERLEAELYLPDISPVDLIIRSSGEHRLSNFMLWRAAYAELAFVDKTWPDFDNEDLDNVLDDYAGRQRRFGS